MLTLIQNINLSSEVFVTNLPSNTYEFNFIQFLIESLIPIIVAATIGYFFSWITTKESRNSDFKHEVLNSTKSVYSEYITTIGKFTLLTREFYEDHKNGVVFTRKDINKLQLLNLEMATHSISFTALKYSLEKRYPKSKAFADYQNLIDFMITYTDKVTDTISTLLNEPNNYTSKFLNENQLMISGTLVELYIILLDSLIDL